MVREERVKEVLTNLGLTDYEIRTLLSLFKLKEAKAPQISQYSQVPKTRIYDILDSLVQRGLIVEMHNRPKRYRIMEAGKVFGTLIEEKKKTFDDIEKEVDAVVKELSYASIPEDQEDTVIKVKSKNDFLKILAQELDNAKDNVIGFIDLDAGHSPLIKSIKGATDRKVNVKILHHRQHKDMKRYLSENLEFKHVNHGLTAFTIDNKKAIIALSNLNKDKSEYNFAIWNHKPIVDVLNNHFAACWDKAKTVQ